MKRLLSILLISFCSTVLANVTVYFNYGIFSTGSSRPYLETYLTISGSSVKFLPQQGQYQANVNVSWKIYKGAEVVKQSNYNLMSPKVTDTLNLPSFIDNQRFALENGEYVLELIVVDNANPASKTMHSEKIKIEFLREKKLYSSDIQVLESFTKAATQSTLSKNGYDLVPYNINYYPKNINMLKFYHETYNIDSVLGKKAKFVYSYYIENAETLTRQQSMNGFQKQNAQKVNPILAQLDITKLPSGNYNLVIEVRDSTNIAHAQKKWFFQRQSNATEDLSINDLPKGRTITTVDEFFGLYKSQDSLKQFIECLWPISSTKEREWQQVQIVKKDPDLMRSFLIDYWKTQAADTADAYKLWITYYKSVLEVNALLKCGKQKGYYTDRGRVYLQYGQPNQRTQVNSEPNTYPYEIWQYYRIVDKTTGRAFTNKKFVFVNFAIADDCYKLIHSDLRGEIYDDKWRFKLVNRSQQTMDVDQTQPGKAYGSNVDDYFNNPR